MTPSNPRCLPEKLISKHAPLKSEHEIYRPTRGIEPRLLRYAVLVGVHCVCHLSHRGRFLYTKT